MDFNELLEVAPCVELAHDFKQDLEAEQKAFPRCFKTHYWYPHCPKGARYIWCLREPGAAAYSFFNMFQGSDFQPGEISVEGFIKEKWLQQGEPQKVTEHASYFHHLTSWWPHRNDPNVLPVFYEDLKEYYESTVRSIAEFMGITDEGHIQVALERGTFEFMKQNSDKFGVTNLMQKCLSAAFGQPEITLPKKSIVRTGTTSEGLKVLSTELLSEIQKKWESVVTPVTGCATYQELREAWKKEKESKCSTAQ